MTAPADRASAALALVADDYAGDPDVERKRTFSSPGLLVRGRIFAFVRRRDERLVVKLPLARVQALVAEGSGELVTMGTRTMREWVAFAPDGDPDARSWRTFAREAHDYVALADSDVSRAARSSWNGNDPGTYPHHGSSASRSPVTA